MMSDLLRAITFWLLVKPFVGVVLGVNARGRERLPRGGPAIVVANHNSHLDTLVLVSLFPTRLLPRLRPVAAGDYFLRGRLRRWFTLDVVRAIPVPRGHRASGGHPLAPCLQALDRGEILLLFPEGSRGAPEELGEFKRGIAHLATARPEVPVHPIALRNTGRALPRGEALFVPYICDLAIGEPLPGGTDRDAFMSELSERFHQLARSLTPTPDPLAKKTIDS